MKASLVLTTRDSPSALPAYVHTLIDLFDTNMRFWINSCTDKFVNVLLWKLRREASLTGLSPTLLFTNFEEKTPRDFGDDETRRMHFQTTVADFNENNWDMIQEFPEELCRNMLKTKRPEKITKIKKWWLLEWLCRFLTTLVKTYIQVRA